MSSPSIKKCEIVQQIKYLPGYPDKWAETLAGNLEREDNIKEWAYILHDHDTEDDGSPKEPHVHIAIVLNEGVKYSTVGGYVGVPAQYVQRPKQGVKKGRRWYYDFGGILSYLTHRNAPDRYQYHDDDVVAKPGYDWMSVRAKSEAAQASMRHMQDLYDDIYTGKVKRYNLTEHITMQAYIDNKPEIEKAFEFRAMMIKNQPDRNIDVIYITGSAGTGKTTLAKQYCKDKGLSYCISGSSRDPVQDYNGQEVLILDDLRPETYCMADLLKMLDNNTASAANARYHDKWLEVTTIIITTVLDINEFYASILQGASEPEQQRLREPIEQLKRRCKTLIKVSRYKIDIYRYNKDTKDYQLVGSKDNPITTQYSQDDREEESARAMCADFGVDYKPEGLPADYLM